MTKIKELIMIDEDYNTYSIAHFEGVAGDALTKAIIKNLENVLTPYGDEEMEEFQSFCGNIQNLLDGYILECKFKWYTFKIREVTQTKYTFTPEEELLNAVDNVATLDNNEKVLLLDLIHLLEKEEYKPYAFNELFHITQKYI